MSIQEIKDELFKSMFPEDKIPKKGTIEFCCPDLCPHNKLKKHLPKLK